MSQMGHLPFEVTKFDFGWGSDQTPPDAARGAHSTPSDLLAVKRGEKWVNLEARKRLR